MPYAAAIKATEEHVLQDMAPCFASAIARIRRREGEWILESSRFEPFQFDARLYAAVNNLVSQIHNVLALYMELHTEPLSVYELLNLTDDDRTIARRLYGYADVYVYIPAKEALMPTASGSLGTDVIARAATDPAIAEALSLVGRPTPGWPLIYDIIEFLGGESSIAALGFATRLETKRVRRTANHYRHLGRPKPDLLPPSPPTLKEATLFAKGILKQWIATRV